MKIHIMTDMEGCAGILDADNYISPSGRYYEQGCELATLEANAAVEGALKAVKSRFAGQAAFERELKAYGIGADELDRALARQAAVLRFIELRFRPQVQVLEAEVRQYYETVYLAECQRKQLRPASFEEARRQCEEALAQHRVDKQVDAWLAEVKGRTRIRYTEAAFQ